MSDGRLRIAMISAHSCPVGTLGSKDTGGMSVYIVELARQLGKQGHVVDAYTRVHDPNDPIIIDLGENARLIHLKAGEDADIHKLAVYSHLPDFACNLEAFRKENGLEYDLVFSHYWLSAWVGRYLEGWWGVPHIAMFHTLGAVKNAGGIGEDEPELRIKTEGELARNCHIIAPTDKEKENLIQYYGSRPERISVVPCGVNMELFRRVDRNVARQRLGLENEKVILFVGRIEPLKGVEQLLKAIPLLPNSQQARLVIVGGDESSQHEVKILQELSLALGIKDRVTFSGIKKQEEMPLYYSAADVCVVPSYYESFGLVTLESLACGTPVVATDVGDMKSIIRQGETGFVVDDNDPGNLARKIALILSRPGMDTESAMVTRASISRYSWPNIAEAIVRECRLVLDGYCAVTP
ncbi:MAG: glycosyltransferase [Dehalococcoidales bacterium]|nr:MAG: glycosyltransferase [Dehalococcoidales bacterium]